MIQEQAEERMELLTGQMKEREGITEQMKVENQMSGSEDEQHRTLGRGDRDDGTDLQLNIEQPEGTYQQLSLFPSFEEQVGTIAAAEASIQYTMPAAFRCHRSRLTVSA